MSEGINLDGGNIRSVPQNMQPPSEVAEKLGAATTSGCITADDLLKDADEVTQVDIDGLGLVKIKPLSMGVSLNIQKAAKGDLAKQTTWIVQKGLVEPQLSPDQIQKCKVGTMTKIVDAINKISGMETETDNLIEDF